MSKDSYDVSSPRRGSFSPNRKDSSFSSCLCIMLVVLVICSLLLLLSFYFKGVAKNKEYKGNKSGKYDSIHGHITTQRNEVVTKEDRKITNQTEGTTERRLEEKKTTLETTSTAETTFTSHQRGKNISTTTDKEGNSNVNVVTTENYGTTTDKEENSNENVVTTENYGTTTEKEVNSTVNVETTENYGTTTDKEVNSTVKVQTTENYWTTTDKEVDSTEKYETTADKEVDSTVKVGTTENYGTTTDKEASSTVNVETTENYGTTTDKEVDSTVNVGTTENYGTTTDKETRSTVNIGTTENYETTTDKEVDSTVNIGTTENYETTADKEVNITVNVETTENYGTTTDTTTENEETTDNSSESSTTLRTFKEGFEEKKNFLSALEIMDAKIDNSPNSKTKKSCESRTCKTMAARIISMDTSRNPCDDFYKYACDVTQIDEDQENDIFKPEIIENESLFMKDFNNFYLSCRNYEDRFDYKKRMKDLFDILNKNVYGRGGTKEKLNELFANLILLEAFPYLEIGVEISPYDLSPSVFLLRKPRYKPSISKYWSSFSEYERKCKGRQKFNATLLKGFDIFQSYSNCTFSITDFIATLKSLQEEKNQILNKTQTGEETESAEKFWKWLATHVGESDDSLLKSEVDTTCNGQICMVRDLQEIYPFLNWTNTLGLLSDGDVNEETLVRVDSDLHMYELNEIDEGHLLKVLESIAEYSIYENIVLQSHVESRTEFCKIQTKNLTPDITNYLYKIISKPELTEQSEYTREIFGVLKKQFRESLNDSKWIDSSSKKKMMKKLDKLSLSMFTDEDDTKERNLLEIRYNGSLKEDDYANNLIYLMKQKNKKLLSLSQRGKVSSSEIHLYLMDPVEKNPLYFHSNEVAYIPYGLVKKASKKLPDYLVMDQVGFPLAKIIGKAFSPIRILDELTNRETKRKLSEFVDQMKNQPIFREPFEFNNHQLLFETSIESYYEKMIVENTALRLVTDLFKTFENQSLSPWIPYNQFSGEKIFFLRLITQEYCQKTDIIDITMEFFQNKIFPPPVRTKNLLINSEKFSKQFNCEGNSSMYSGKLQFPYFG